MEEILILLLQFVFELVIQIIGSGIVDLFTWPMELNDRPTPPGCTIVGLVFVGGLCLGGLSLLIFNHTMLPYTWLRIANLVVGPCVSALLSWRIATWRQKRHQLIRPDLHAWMGGLACLGFILVRFTWCIR